MLKQLLVSVVVPVYNAEKTISACLDSLIALDFPREKMEILVVDNHSTDRTKEIVLLYPVRYVFEPNRGRAWARNRGIQNARGEFIAFTDADCVVAKDWLKNLVNGMVASPDVAMAGGDIIGLKQKNVIEKFYERLKHYHQDIGIRGLFEHDLPRVVTANAICRKSIIERLGCFDEDLVTCEDTELSWRASLSGYEIKYIPEAVVHHKHINNIVEFCRHHFIYGVGDWAVYQKYRSFIKGEHGVPNKNPAQIFWEDIRSQIYFNFRMIADKHKEFSIDLLLVYILQKISHSSGWLMTGFRTFIYGEIWKKKPKINFEDFFRRNVIFRENGTLWSLSGPCTWFVNGCFLKMIVYEDFRTYKFNRVATRIWQSLCQTERLDKTSEEIAGNYGISGESALQDVREFINNLEKEAVLRRL